CVGSGCEPFGFSPAGVCSVGVWIGGAPLFAGVTGVNSVGGRVAAGAGVRVAGGVPSNLTEGEPLLSPLNRPNARPAASSNAPAMATPITKLLSSATGYT